MLEGEGYGRPEAVEKREPSSPVSDSLTPQSIRAVQGVSDAQYEWVDRGIIDVPVKDLPKPENVNSPADFNHNITWEDAVAVTKRLPEIQAEVNAGKTGADFSAEDQAADVSRSESKRRLFDLYYGSDPVTLGKDGNDYTIDKGRHRVYAAQALGIETIPARVKERVKKS